MAQAHDILYKAEYIRDVLYFAVTKPGKEFKNTSETYYFSIDNELIYENYYSDFGPLNLSCVYKYCTRLNDILKCLLNKQIIVHYTSVDPAKKANAAFLMGCFGIIYLSLQPKDALRPLMVHGQNYRPFQDATQGTSMYTISLLDCLQAIKKARDLNFFNFQDFDCDEYDKLDRIQGGDLNWIIPGKFLAFIGPVEFSPSLYHPPEMYVDYFLKNNVGLVIRLNKRLYDGNVFRNKGIAHCDLFFPDGSCPPRHIIFKFLQISEEIDSAIAVHCKAGLGRTGSLIGCYLIKHYRMTALEAIGWMRICRPGSVIGHQQGWLVQLEQWLIKQGNLYRKRVYQHPDKLPVHTYGVHSIAQKSSNQRPVVMSNKMPSPPPLGPRKFDSSSPVRPQASKIREVHDKSPDNKLSDRTVQSQRSGSPMYRKGYEKTSVYRGIIGEGDPRPPRPTDSTNRIRATVRSTANSITPPATKTPSGFHPMPPFHVLHSPLISNVSDARNFLLRPSTYDPKKDLGTSLKVTPQLSRQPPTESTYRHPPTISSANATVNRERRRLGRSPSPSPVRGMSPDCRHLTASGKPINTQTTVVPVQQANVSKERIGSANRSYDQNAQKTRTGDKQGARPHQRASFGAASLDARRTAPKPLISSSTHSDERPLATQGDMLNSIKLRRRYKESMQLNKLNTLCSSKEKSTVSQCVSTQAQSWNVRSSMARPLADNMTQIQRDRLRSIGKLSQGRPEE